MTRAVDPVNGTLALLVRAALGDEEEAARSWSLWAATGDLDTLDPAAGCLLPLISRRVSPEALGETAGRLRGIHRYHWTRNQLFLSGLEAALARLASAGIRPAVVGGPALATRCYPDLGSRPTDAADLVIEPRAIPETTTHLRDLGWRPVPTSGPPLPRGWRPVTFRTEPGFRLIVHPTRDWSTFQLERVRAGSLEVTSLDATATLLAVCAGSRRFHEPSPLGWIPDATFLLRAARDTLDWTRIAVRVAAGRIALALRGRLGYLRGAGLAPVPSEEALDVLHRLQPPVVRRLAARVARTLSSRWAIRARLGFNQW